MSPHISPLSFNFLQILKLGLSNFYICDVICTACEVFGSLISRRGNSAASCVNFSKLSNFEFKYDQLLQKEKEREFTLLEMKIASLSHS